MKNLADGRVELWAEGEPAEVQGFLEAIGRCMAENIEDQRGYDETLAGMKDFAIRQ